MRMLLDDFVPDFDVTERHAIVVGAPPAATLTTETRIAGTDDAARRGFRRYWRLISIGSAAIRVEWLRAIRRRAERG